MLSTVGAVVGCELWGMSMRRSPLKSLGEERVTVARKSYFVQSKQCQGVSRRVADNNRS